MEAIKRIHHITAIVGDPNENIEFYRDVLGLRLVKQTVNFDDPGVYHLYFGDYDGSPGTIITFFNWVVDRPGVKGSGQVGRIAFRIPKGSMTEWENHLKEQNIKTEHTKLFGKDTLQFDDVHGLELALVEGDSEADTKDIIGFHGAVLLSGNPDGTKELLVRTMGLTELNINDRNYHFETAGEEKHHIVTELPPKPRGSFGIGTVHHIAWSVPNLEVLEEWQTLLQSKNFDVTEVRDRNYFKSIYTSERGDVVFEFATDEPGFDVDEDKSELGSSMQLPPQYEHKREEYERTMPKLNL